jgi:hypothetical protein
LSEAIADFCISSARCVEWLAWSARRMLARIEPSSAVAAALPRSRARPRARDLVARGVEHVRLDAVPRVTLGRVAVNRDEQVGPELIGASGALL